MNTGPKTYSALGADLTLAAEAISRARIAVHKASDPDALRHAAAQSEDAEEALTQILSRRGVLRYVCRACASALLDIHALADIKRNEAAIFTKIGANGGEAEIRYIIPFSFGSPSAREHLSKKLPEALHNRGYDVINDDAGGCLWTAELRAARRD